MWVYIISLVILALLAWLMITFFFTPPVGTYIQPQSMSSPAFHARTVFRILNVLNLDDGALVTGVVDSGTIRVGNVLKLEKDSPKDLTVMDIEVSGKKAGEARAGEKANVLVSDLPDLELHRGDVLVDARKGM
ncbi:MAG: hypothetical protein AB1458_08205 [Bacteroidota bacterium]